MSSTSTSTTMGRLPGDASTGTTVTRQAQYLIAPRTYAGGLRPLATEAIVTALNELPGVSIVRRIKPRGVGALSAGDGGMVGEVIVARTSIERGRELEAASRAGAAVIVERDELLNHHGLTPLEHMATTGVPGIFSRNRTDVRFRVTDTAGTSLVRAQVTVYGRNIPGQAETDASGDVAVPVFGETPESIRAVYVKPAADCWERFVDQPQLDFTGVNTVVLQPLSATFKNFPGQQMIGWGARLMGLDRISDALNGRGVKVGIIDSGCDNTHPMLRQVTNGVDLTNAGDTSTWIRDEISHGTHCTGVIAGIAAGPQGIRGFAPAADVHVFKVFPGGRFSDLIDALDLCIEQQIDLINCSLGSDQFSEIVQRKLEEARQRGIACVVAVGNSSGPVQFPATLPTVLSVAAVGQENTYPPDTYHAQTRLPGLMGVNGTFPAKFSCFGPEVRVSGPGVAIISSVPGGYAAWDGTSMAAPHLTGLAALVLAHHPLFQGPLRVRTAQRVDALFQMIVSACTPIIADPLRGGAGLPDVARLLTSTGIAAGAVPTQPTIPQLAAVLGPALGGLAGVPFGPQLGAVLGQLLSGAAGTPPFMFGAGGIYGPALQPGAEGAAMNPYMTGGIGARPQLLMQLRALGLA